MKDTLKVAGRIGAELGAAKAEVERLREALRPFATFEAVRSKQGGCTPKHGTVWAVASAGEDAEITVEHLQAAVAALSQKAEPTDTYTAVDMATAAAQGFRDGQAAVEQAAAQDEREAFKRALHSQKVFKLSSATMSAAEWAWFARPAQTEQKPEQMNISPLLNAGAALSNIAFNLAQRQGVTLDQIVCDTLSSARKSWDAARADLSAKGAGKFRMGDLVKKSTGSEWEGRVVGTYSTEQTKEGYAVESSAHRNSVQIYPATALEAVE